tara:strand:- start:41 stop:301 length:261 start_codon:yes stop_codon:yes gene_type:complete
MPSIQKIIEKRKILGTYLGILILLIALKLIEQIPRENNSNPVSSKPIKTTSVFIEVPMYANSGVTKNTTEPKSAINLVANKNLHTQ